MCQPCWRYSRTRRFVGMRYVADLVCSVSCTSVLLLNAGPIAPRQQFTWVSSPLGCREYEAGSASSAVNVWPKIREVSAPRGPSWGMLRTKQDVTWVVPATARVTMASSNQSVVSTYIVRSAVQGFARARHPSLPCACPSRKYTSLAVPYHCRLGERVR